MTKPEVSVVIGVYNGASDLQRTIESVLAQQGVEFECVVVDDGSTDETPRLLEAAAARDSRIRVLRQENRGLTHALILGCETARGDFIARQDVGDLSSPERLRHQLRAIRQSPDIGLVSCWAQYVGPEGEPLYRVTPEPEGATDRMRSFDLGRFQGPAAHVAVMFSRELYLAVGGYRPQFYFAQDLDLWTRLAERRTHIVVPEILVEVAVARNSLTQGYREQQIATARVIFECVRLRRAGLDETQALLAAAMIRPTRQDPISALTRARSLYFIGSCLRRQGDRRARKYFREALSAFPLHIRSLVGLALSLGGV